MNERGWTRVATVAADYSFGYTNFLGFAADFCAAGGEIVERFWVPLGSSDFGAVIAALPYDVDAIYLGIGGTDAINFLNQYENAGGDKPILGGSITVSQDVLNYKGKRRDSLVGTLSAQEQSAGTALVMPPPRRAAWVRKAKYTPSKVLARFRWGACTAGV